MDSSLTSSALRLGNRRRVLEAVYQSKEISKQGIVQMLGLSLPTITQNLNEFETMGLIRRQGLFDSTGGRKAQVYHFSASARVAIGVLLLKEGYHIVATDLYGRVIKSSFIPEPLSRTSAYFHQFGSRINLFIREMEPKPGQILGVAIAVQGLVTPDGSRIFWGEVANCTDLTLDDMQMYIDYPCTFIHDTEATAEAELWIQNDLQNAVLLSLSRNFSGIMIINGVPHRGNTLCGTIEHMRLYPNGPRCYCGKHGCVEVYCSSDALLRNAGKPLQEFFFELRAGDQNSREIWYTYLHNLTLVINNIRMMVDMEYIISGYLLKFMNDEDFELLAKFAAEDCSFDIDPVRIRRSVYSEDVAACGAAISLVKAFLESI